MFRSFSRNKIVSSKNPTQRLACGGASFIPIAAPISNIFSHKIILFSNTNSATSNKCFAKSNRI